MKNPPLVIFILAAFRVTTALVCYSSDNIAHCDNIWMFSRTDPVQLVGNPKSVYFSQVYGEIPAESFEDAVSVVEMTIYSGITYIEPEAFKGFRSLVTLILSNNTIRYLVKGTFKGCSNLRQLILRDNSINYIEPGAFDELYRLDYLDLSNNVDLGVLKDYMFRGLGSLKVLQCASCGIYQIEPLAFYGASNIENLDLQSNYLGDIKGGEFENLLSLSELNLNNNVISNINLEEFFHTLYNLNSVWLVNNRISCIDAPDLERRFEERGITLHIKVRDRDNEIIYSCCEPFYTPRPEEETKVFYPVNQVYPNGSEYVIYI